MPDFLMDIIDQLGIMPFYIFIIAVIGISVSGMGQLVAGLAILSGVYIVLFKYLNQKLPLDVLDISNFIAMPDEQGHMITAVIVFFVIGVTVFKLKKKFIS